MENIVIKNVDVMGDSIMAVQDGNGNIYAGVNNFCDALGMTRGQKDKQVQNVQKDEALEVGCFRLEVGNFQLKANSSNGMLLLKIDFIPLWLAKITITDKTKQERPEFAEKLLQYQLKAKDILAEAFVPKQLYIQNQQPVNEKSNKVTAKELLSHQNKMIEKMQEQNYEFQRTVFQSFQSLAKITQTVLERTAENLPQQDNKALPEKSKYVAMEVGAFEKWRDEVYRKARKIQELENGKYNTNQIFNYVYIYMKNTFGLDLIQEVKEYREYFGINGIITNLEVIFSVESYRKIFDRKIDDMIADLESKEMKKAKKDDTQQKALTENSKKEEANNQPDTENKFQMAVELIDKWCKKYGYQNPACAYRRIYKEMDIKDFSSYKKKHDLPLYVPNKTVIECDEWLTILFYKAAEKLYKDDLK